MTSHHSTAEHHALAADHHELAAGHHRQAVRSHEEGDLDGAAHHAYAASGHGHHAATPEVVLAGAGVGAGARGCSRGPKGITPKRRVCSLNTIQTR